ncbi:MAG TPA: hypothetical protein PLF48_01825 [Chitinophagales bacterium]|nr:hypothetical protein [Chitinophagales bacterium]
MEHSLKIKLIKKKRRWNDVGPFAFKFIPVILISIIISLLLINGYNYVYTYLILILIYILYLTIFDNRKYDWWLVNYDITGILFLKNDSIEIEENGIRSIYKVNKLHKIQIKENFFQNYTRMRDIVHDGIGSILIDNGINKNLAFFLIENESDLESLHALKAEWKRLGLSIWT